MLNKISKIYQQKGLNLMELMLVVAVSAIIIIGGVRQYYGQTLQAKIELVKRNVDLLTRGLQQNWYVNCASATTDLAGSSSTKKVRFTSNDVLTAIINTDIYSEIGIHPNTAGKITAAPFGSGLYGGEWGYMTTTIAGKQNTVPYTTISARFDQTTPEVRNQIAAQTAGTVSGTTISWTRIINQSVTNNQLWLLHSDMERFRSFEDTSNVCSLGHAGAPPS